MDGIKNNVIVATAAAVGGGDAGERTAPVTAAEGLEMRSPAQEHMSSVIDAILERPPDYVDPAVRRYEEREERRRRTYEIRKIETKIRQPLNRKNAACATQ